MGDRLGIPSAVGTFCPPYLLFGAIRRHVVEKLWKLKNHILLWFLTFWSFFNVWIQKKDMEKKEQSTDWEKDLLEAPGIDPGTSRMLSERSTI